MPARIAAILCFLYLSGSAAAEPAPLRLGLYLPSHLGSAEERLLYATSLAQVLSRALGRPVSGKAYARFADLRAAHPELAVVDGQCALAMPSARALAIIETGGATSEPWALFSQKPGRFSELRGARLAHVATGCRDDDVLYGMLWGEVPLRYFGARVARPNLNAALATVRDYGAADLVFAPASKGGGLHRVFTTADLPNPVLLQLGREIDERQLGGVLAALASAGAPSQLGSWRVLEPGQLQQLARNLQPGSKAPLFAAPRPEALEVLPAFQLPAITLRADVDLGQMIVPP